MGFLKFVKQIGDDFSTWLRCNKSKFWLTTFCALCGVIAGCVIFCNCSHGFWYINRCNYVSLLLGGNGFALLAELLVQTLLIVLLVIVSQISKHLIFVRYLTLIVGCIYAGAHLAGLFAKIGFIAVLFLIFYTLLVLLTLTMVCFTSGYPTEYRKTFSEIWQDAKKQIIVIFAISLAKILLLFLLLRPLCSSI